MGVPYYVPWVQNVAKTATVTVPTGTADPTLDLQNVVAGDPALGVRILGTSGRWVLSFSSAVSVAVLGLIHHSFKAGLAIRLEGHTSATFTGSPGPDFSANITIPARTVDGYGNAWLDVQAANSGAVPSFQHWSLVVDADTNDVNLALGEIVLGSIRNELPRWLDLRSHQLGTRLEAVVHRTYAQTPLTHPKTFPVELFGSQILVETPAAYQALLDWFRLSSGQGLPSLVIPDSEESPCHFGLFTSGTQGRTILVPGDPTALAVAAVDWTFEEQPNGLTWD